MGGCGCKKRQEAIQQQVVNQQQQQQVNVTVTESTSQSQVQLTPEQQQQVNKIISKIENLQNNQ